MLLPLRSEIENVAAGWSWFSWHKQVADYVLKYLNENPKYLYRFKYTACCDEVIFQGLLEFGVMGIANGILTIYTTYV